MATTESRTGFRLPWSSEERSDKAPVDRTTEAPSTDEATDAMTQATSAEPEVVDQAPPADAEATDSNSSGEQALATGTTEIDQPTASDSSLKETSVDSTATAESAPSPVASVAPVPRKPTKFVLDLTRAMQSAAEESRAQTLGQFQADAKTYIEEIHSRSAVEATELRKRSDEDITGIQDWSKAEIARIREETQGKISERKLGLERELEDHAGQIEYEIDRVQSRVAGFELEMERFFEQLVAEADPTQIAVMAQSLPEPPSFDASVPWQPSAAVAELIGDTTVVASSSPPGTEAETAEAGEQPAGDLAPNDGVPRWPPSRPPTRPPRLTGRPVRPRQQPKRPPTRTIRAWPPSACRPTTMPPRPKPPPRRPSPVTTRSRRWATMPSPPVWPAWFRPKATLRRVLPGQPRTRPPRWSCRAWSAWPASPASSAT